MWLISGESYNISTVSASDASVVQTKLNQGAEKKEFCWVTNPNLLTKTCQMRCFFKCFCPQRNENSFLFKTFCSFTSGQLANYEVFMPTDWEHLPEATISMAKLPLKGWCRRSWPPGCRLADAVCTSRAAKQTGLDSKSYRALVVFMHWRSSRNNIVVHSELWHFTWSPSLYIYTFGSGSISGEQPVLDQLTISTLAWMIDWTYGFLYSWGKMKLQIHNPWGKATS